jgi:hypothetical protein
MNDGLVHIQILQVLLFIADDHIYIVFGCADNDRRLTAGSSHPEEDKCE